MTLTDSELLQLQKKAERQRIEDFEPEFQLDVARLDELAQNSIATTGDEVGRAMRNSKRDLADLAALLSPAALDSLESIAGLAHRTTVQRFGRTMHLFAPLYLSNECVSECTYCGFQVWNRDIVRRTLSPDEVEAETRYLASLSFRHVLLVAGEHPKHVSAPYITECIERVAAHMPHVSIEVQAWDTDTYKGFVHAGCDGVVLYQEAYDRRVYPDFHLKGNKRFFSWRLGAVERAGDAGARRLGIGTLLGLNPNWRWEVLALAAHAKFLLRQQWRSDITIALPRLEPATGFDDPPGVLSDTEFTLAIAALRLALPDVGIVLSTREPVRLRDGLVRIGPTHMSAGSRTEPGGYTEPGRSEPQFEISDERPASQVAAMLVEAGYDPVWKDDSPVLRRGSDDGR